MTERVIGCPLCAPAGEVVLWRDRRLRVIRVADDDYPGYLRVIWHAHVREMSDLDAAAREHVMRVVLAAEECLRKCMRPDKINLASFGNMVPHLHWHVVARFGDDRHFPQPIWGAAQRDVGRRVRAVPSDGELRACLQAAIERLRGCTKPG